MHPNFIEALEGDEIVVSWQGDSRLLTNLETIEANKQDRITNKRLVRQAEDMLGKSKTFKLNTPISPPSNADAYNQVKVAKVLPPGQKCTFTIMTGANPGLVSQK